MEFISMKERRPDKKGTHLVVRNRFGLKWYEILKFDGKFWITGYDPDAVIEKWCELENLQDD